MDVGVAFQPFLEKPKKPHLHPMIQIMTSEWKAAGEEGWQPHWFIFTDSFLQHVCNQVMQENPKWNADLSLTDLSPYMAGMPHKWQWWLVDGPDGAF